MDRALKERLIGASVLVVLAVLIVPVFLDGPPNDAEMVSEAVTLPGQNDQERTKQVVVLNLDRTEPVPTSAPSIGLESKPEPARSEPPTETNTPETNTPETTSNTAAPAPVSVKTELSATTESSTGMWAVQLGSFSNQANAERLAADLRDQGYAAFLSKLESGSGNLHRVRIGPQKDRDSAEAVATQLARSGHSGQVVPHP